MNIKRIIDFVTNKQKFVCVSYLDVRDIDRSVSREFPVIASVAFVEEYRRGKLVAEHKITGIDVYDFGVERFFDKNGKEFFSGNELVLAINHYKNDIAEEHHREKIKALITDFEKN